MQLMMLQTPPKRVKAPDILDLWRQPRPFDLRNGGWMDYRIWLGALATGIALVSYIPYLGGIFNGSTRPHAFTWLVWGVMTGIGFAAQVAKAGGPGSWVTGFSAVVSIFIFGLSLWHGEKDIRLSDWACLAVAGFAILLWLRARDPLGAVILITLIDMVAFFPTFRKSFTKPGEERLVTYMLSAVKYVLALIALTNVTLVTVLYPASLVLMNGLFVLFVLLRRRILLAPI
jgi:hypothetical protein